MASTTGPASGLVEQNLFRDVIGCFASGVTVITTHAGGAHHGTTASAVSSLSMDPPMVLVCLNKTSQTQSAVAESGCFAINILGADQGGIAYQFATKSGPAKFEGVEVTAGYHEVPLVKDAIAHIECRVAEAVTGGTHTVFLAEVENAAAIEGGAPLTYFRGKFGRFETELEEAAYRELRRMVLERKLPIGAPLDVDQLAAELNQERPRIFYALTKLSLDGLVARDATGYRISPLTVYASDQAYDARCTVELGVAEETVPIASEQDLEEMRAHVEATDRTVEGDNPELAAFQRENRAFHEHQVSLSRNQAVIEFYRRLGISAISTRALDRSDWPAKVMPEHHRELLKAYLARDVEAAKRVIQKHNSHAKEVAREVIEAAGGEL